LNPRILTAVLESKKYSLNLRKPQKTNTNATFDAQPPPLGGAPRRTVATTEEVAESWARVFEEKT
jgi:hypothetical protein